MGELADRETSIQKTTDVPLADFYMARTKRGEIQVYRADAKTIHFSILDGVNNPTYTFVHQVETRWTVIPENPYKTQGKAIHGISLPPGKKRVQ
jgi:hypothetical protein